MGGRIGPRTNVIAAQRMVVDGRSQYLLRLACGHHVLRHQRGTHANCGHCAHDMSRAVAR